MMLLPREISEMQEEKDKEARKKKGREEERNIN